MRQRSKPAGEIAAKIAQLSPRLVQPGPRKELSRRKAERELQPNPMRLYRVGRLARLFDVDPTTVWRWKQQGILPHPAVTFPGFSAWTEDQIASVLEARRQGSATDE